MKQVSVTEIYLVDGQQINASSYLRALEKVLMWNGLHIETKEICDECGEEYFQLHKCEIEEI